MNGFKGKSSHLLLAAVLLIVDQVLKFYLSSFPQGVIIYDVIPNFFNITVLINPGVAFGVLNNFPHILIWLNVFIFASFFTYFIFGLNRTSLYLDFALILAGAASNLMDRFIYGGVLDYLNFTFFPTFNLADSYITIAVCLILKDAIFKKE